MSKPIDLTGQKINRWFIESLAHIKGYDKYYNCVCECGTRKIVLGQNIRNGKSKSCGCEKHKQACNFRDRTGERYHHLTCLKWEKRGDYIYWLCKCDCGNETWVRGINLSSGAVKSCGCLNEHHNRIHGMSHTRLHGIWSKMNERCFNKNHKYYRNYGGRGISICDEWLGTDGFIRFMKWANDSGYTDKLTLDRIDVNGNYEPGNCRWVTMQVQSNNKRDTRFLEYDGQKMSIADWARLKEMKYATLIQRIDVLGWPVEKALTKEVRDCGRT